LVDEAARASIRSLLTRRGPFWVLVGQKRAGGDPANIPVPTLVARGEYDGIASMSDLLAFF